MRPMFLLGLSVLIVGLVIGIAIGIDSSESPPDGLEGTWVLRYYGEPGKLRVPYPWRDITLTISACATAEQKIGDYPARDYVVITYAGVNRCWGNCEVDGNKFTYYMDYCTEALGLSHLRAQEDRYLDILTSAQTYEITNCRLIISSGEELLGFKRNG